VEDGDAGHGRLDGGDGLPGIGFPRWQVELLKVRNGKPGSWQLEWVSRKFQPVASRSSLLTKEHKQAV
jgi:protein ImuA